MSTQLYTDFLSAVCVGEYTRNIKSMYVLDLKSQKYAGEYATVRERVRNYTLFISFLHICK